MKELIDKVSQWHHDRNLIHGSTHRDQVLKMIQELGELSDSVCSGRDPKDDIGDMLVIAINIAERLGVDLQFDTAYSTDAKEAVMFALHCVNELPQRLSELVDVLTGLAQLHGHTLEECLAHAYDEIKDRKGRMVDGIFIKDI